MKILRNVYLLILVFTQARAQTQPIPQQDVLADVYRERIASIKSGIQLIYRDEVRFFIEQYLQSPDQTQKTLLKAKRMFPMIERELKLRNLPAELKFIPMAASGMDALKTGSNGESGMWMMLYNVSKMYKGKVNTYVDERRDPQRSTQIATTHFKDLYAIYYHWPLAITAYAVSPFTLNKTVRRAENSLYFWDLYELLPLGSRDLYPRLVAAIYIYNFHNEHGILLPPDNEPRLDLDSVRVKKWLSFDQITTATQLPIEFLRETNPIFRKDVIPYSQDGYWIYLPKNKIKQFEQLKDVVYNPYNNTKDSLEQLEAPTTKTNPINKPQPPAFDKVKLFYTVKKGDNLGDIARWYGVSLNEIKSWNNLKTNTIFAGQKLVVWVKSSRADHYKRVNTMTRAEKNRGN